MSEEIIIFVHIPKCAGISMGSRMRDIYGRKRVYWAGNDRMEVAASECRKKNIKVLTGHIPFGAHRYVGEPFRYMTMLRDPVERLLSLYYHYKLRGKGEVPGIQNMSFAQFLRLDRAELDNEQVRYLSGSRELTFVPPSRWMGKRDLARAKENIEEFDVLLGLVERFDEAVLLFADAFGWQNRDKGKKFNATSRKGEPPVPEGVLEEAKRRQEWDYLLYDYARQRLGR